MSTVPDVSSVIGPFKMIVVDTPKEMIKHIIRQLGLTSQSELAERFGLPLSDIENASKGSSRKKLEVIYEKARKELGLPKEWPGSQIMPIERVKSLTRIKVLGEAMAGDGADFQPEEMDYEVPAHLVTGIEFGFWVRGSSLMKKVKPRDLLIARPCKEPVYNRIMIVRRPDQTVSAKIVLWRDGQTVLASTDGRDLEPAEVEYMGVVTAWMRPSTGANVPSPDGGMRYSDLPFFDEDIDEVPKMR